MGGAAPPDFPHHAMGARRHGSGAPEGSATVPRERGADRIVQNGGSPSEKVLILRLRPSVGAGAPGFDAFHMARSQERIVIKRYAGRRLYHPGAEVYLTSQDLVAMAQRGENIVVIDAATGDDVSDSVVPIIVKH